MRVGVTASIEEVDNIRQELVKWSTEEIIIDMNLMQAGLDYGNPEKTRIGWLTLMLENEELGKRNCLFLHQL